MIFNLKAILKGKSQVKKAKVEPSNSREVLASNHKANSKKELLSPPLVNSKSLDSKVENISLDELVLDDLSLEDIVDHKSVTSPLETNYFNKKKKLSQKLDSKSSKTSTVEANRSKSKEAKEEAYVTTSSTTSKTSSLKDSAIANKSKKKKKDKKIKVIPKEGKIQLSSNIQLITTNKAKPQKASAINKYSSKVKKEENARVINNALLEEKEKHLSSSSLQEKDASPSPSLTKSPIREVKQNSPQFLGEAKEESVIKEQAPKLRAIDDIKNPLSPRYRGETVSFKYANSSSIEKPVSVVNRKYKKGSFEDYLNQINLEQEYIEAKDTSKQDSFAYRSTSYSFSNTLEVKEQKDLSSHKKKESFIDLYTEKVDPLKSKGKKDNSISGYRKGASKEIASFAAQERSLPSINKEQGTFASSMESLRFDKKFSDDTVDLSRDRARAQKNRNIQAGIPIPKKLVEAKANEALRQECGYHKDSIIPVFTKDNYSNAKWKVDGINSLAYADFKKGRIDSEIIEIDLHKSTVESSKRIIFNTIKEALKTECCIIRIITGHGKEILKEQVPNYLVDLYGVLAFIPKKDASKKTNGFLVLLNNLDKKYQ